MGVLFHVVGSSQNIWKRTSALFRFQSSNTTHCTNSKSVRSHLNEYNPRHNIEPNRNTAFTVYNFHRVHIPAQSDPLCSNQYTVGFLLSFVPRCCNVDNGTSSCLCYRHRYMSDPPAVLHSPAFAG